MKTRYFPWTEVILLVLAITVSCAFLLILKISFWLLIPAVIFAYFMTMRDTSVIVLDAEKLKIISLNFLIGAHSIPRRSIIKINSIQTLQDETYEVYGAPYLTLKTKYELEYLNIKEKKTKVHFSISNRQKEKSIMENLKVDQVASK